MSSRLGAVARSLVLLTVSVLAVPWSLVIAARARFGGPTPWSSIAPIDEWRVETLRRALTERLDESTLTDLVIRGSLGVAWLAVGAFALTVVLETLHMARHDGLAMPRLRGIGFGQPLARMIAAGLLVAAPPSASARIASATGPELLAMGSQSASSTLPFDEVMSPTPASQFAVEGHALRRTPTESDAVYVVRPGDSVFSIAERLAGPDPNHVRAFADELLELNLGRRMVDGKLFSNAALIHAGWALELPGGSGAGTDAPLDDRHVVVPGETLWSIARDRLGDPDRWVEIHELNRGRTFADGRVLEDPNVIQPGWDLQVVDPMAVGVTTDPTPDTPTSPTAGVPPVVPDVIDGIDDDVAPVEERLTSDDATPVDEVPDTVAAVDGAAQPENAWLEPLGVETIAPAGSSGPSSSGHEISDDSPDSIRLFTYRRAAMLSAGLLVLLTVRRRTRLRTAPAQGRPISSSPASIAVERSLRSRSLDGGDRFARVDLAIRHAALPLVETGTRVQAVLIGSDGELELVSADAASLPPPWEPIDDARQCRWRLRADVPVETLAEGARRVGGPCPTLVQLGSDADDREVYVDLEAVGAIEVGGTDADGDAVVAAVAATLASSVLAEVTTLVGVAVPEETFLGHRQYRPAHDLPMAWELATDAVGATRHAERTTFDLRARVTSGEMWEPAVVLAGSSAGLVAPPANMNGLALVSAAPIHGPSARLAPAGEAWELLPAGLRFVPIGLPPDDGADLARLLDVDVAPPTGRPTDPDATIDGATIERPSEEATASTSPAVVVRLLGPVRVESADGRSVEFERSKTHELVAWLATHRARSTRSNARAALWEIDVRDATFHNVVSEARRALARCVDPPEGEEWLGRTTNDELPLHPLVVTDAELVERALEHARDLEPHDALEVLHPALDWVVGTPFEGTSYLWSDAEGIASDAIVTALSLCETCARVALSVGDVETAFEASARGLQVLPAHEGMVEIRMRAHAQVGDRAALRHEWQGYERAITADPWSDGEPSDRLVALRNELLTTD